jgi:hypothetical protein
MARSISLLQDREKLGNTKFYHYITGRLQIIHRLNLHKILFISIVEWQYFHPSTQWLQTQNPPLIFKI